jgi:acyl-CoA dehydrogenase
MNMAVSQMQVRLYAGSSAKKNSLIPSKKPLLLSSTTSQISMAAHIVSRRTFPSGRIFTPASDELNANWVILSWMIPAANPFQGLFKTMCTKQY